MYSTQLSPEPKWPLGSAGESAGFAILEVSLDRRVMGNAAVTQSLRLVSSTWVVGRENCVSDRFYSEEISVIIALFYCTLISEPYLYSGLTCIVYPSSSSVLVEPKI